MQTIVMEFENERDMRETIDKLWTGGKATGELNVRPLSGGRWRLELISEGDIKDRVLERLPGKVIGADGTAADKGSDEAEAEVAAAGKGD